MAFQYRPAFLDLGTGYTRSDLLTDIGAGMLVGVVALPLSMGLAIASGCKPEQGLWTAIVAGILVSLLGGTRVQIGGPAGAFVGLCAAGVNQFGYSGLALATLMSGALILFMGVARLGKAISYVPTPVVIGFTTGIALILLSTQLGPALGVRDPVKPIDNLAERLVYLKDHLRAGEFSWRALVCCASTVALIQAFRRISTRIPGALLALLIVGGMSWALQWEGEGPNSVMTIQTQFGGISHGLPAPALPSLGLQPNWHIGELMQRMKDLSALALALALLGSIESLLSAVVSDGMSGFRHDSSSELIGQGIANLVTPFFQGMPATGVIARTSTNVRAGARSPIAGVVHSLTVLIIMLVAGPLVVHVPLAALAGVLLVVCWYMAELRHWPHILKAGRSDAALLPIAFLLTAFIGLVQAILVGVVLAMFFFVKRMSDTAQVEKYSSQDLTEKLQPIPKGVEVYEVRGPIFFGAATMIRDLDSNAGEHARIMILRLRLVPFIDTTAAFSLRELHASLKYRGGRLLVSDVHTRALHDLERHGIVELIGVDSVHHDLASALDQGTALLAQSPKQAIPVVH
jgi:SulP family sulfate permease